MRALVFVLMYLALASIAEATECGVASYYSYTGRLTATGEPFNGSGMTAAHKTLPLGTWVRVTDQRSLRSIDVRINDRGPYIAGRIIDLSHEAMRALAGNAGLAKVCVDVLSSPTAPSARPKLRPSSPSLGRLLKGLVF